MQERKSLIRRIINKIRRKKTKPDILPSEEPALPVKSREELKDDLLKAEVNDDNAEIERLIRAGPDISAKGYDNWTALGLVAAKGNTKACALLIQKHKECGGDIKKLIRATNKYGMTVLQWAAYNGNTETCALIMDEYAKAGGNVKRLVAKGTALHFAASLGHDETCILLMQRYAKAGGRMDRLIAAKNKAGGTALHSAAEKGYVETCKLLLEEYAKAGGNVAAFISARDDDGRTATQYAKDHNQTQTVQFLANELFKAILGNETFGSFMESFNECIAA